MNYVIIAVIVVLMATLDALASEKAEEDVVDQIEKMLELDDEAEPTTRLNRKPNTMEIVKKIALRKDNEHPLKPFVEDKTIKMSKDSETKDEKNISETEEALTDEN